MLVAVVADIHANAVALRRVWEDLPHQVEEIWLLGDVFGRGPEPWEVWDLLREQQSRLRLWLAGNWDWGLLGRLWRGHFRPIWHENLQFQRQHLQYTPEWSQIERRLEALPFARACPRWSCVAVHASFGFSAFPPPSEPALAEQVLGEYLWGPVEVQRAWQRWQAYCRQPWPHPRLALSAPLEKVSWFLVAHTHRPFWITPSPTGFGEHPLTFGRWMEPQAPFPWVLNPGSVGAARDLDGNMVAEAYYLLVELHPEMGIRRFQFRRLPYAFPVFQEAMRLFYGPRQAAKYFRLWHFDDGGQK